MHRTLVFLGNVYAERLPLRALASEFGWSTETVASLDELRRIGVQRDIVAVLFDPRTMRLDSTCALEAVQDAAPDALAIVCHKSSESIPWLELTAAGAFHALLLPLDADEVRQSLAFVCAAQTVRRSKVISLQRSVATYTRNVASAEVA